MRKRRRTAVVVEKETVVRPVAAVVVEKETVVRPVAAVVVIDVTAPQVIVSNSKKPKVSCDDLTMMKSSVTAKNQITALKLLSSERYVVATTAGCYHRLGFSKKMQNLIENATTVLPPSMKARTVLDYACSYTLTYDSAFTVIIPISMLEFFVLSIAISYGGPSLLHYKDQFKEAFIMPLNPHLGRLTLLVIADPVDLYEREVFPDGILYASCESHYSVFKAARMYRMVCEKEGHDCTTYWIVDTIAIALCCHCCGCRIRCRQCLSWEKRQTRLLGLKIRQRNLMAVYKLYFYTTDDDGNKIKCLMFHKFLNFSIFFYNYVYISLASRIEGCQNMNKARYDDS
ncbi:hypothetical protein L1987_82285 [Smallanthus sonchifolius]|uniref:Uncharacterized protein n=1 Tax=Smallanthus sonchifolius TaxID=185202 RepID=A0ACB8YAX7_9ASTR|nr:hypothetical protein L1987_82285 [Smallanthus sonchifolius]